MFKKRRANLLKANSQQYPFWGAPLVQRPENMLGVLLSGMFSELPTARIPLQTDYNHDDVKRKVEIKSSLSKKDAAMTEGTREILGVAKPDNAAYNLMISLAARQGGANGSA